MTITQHVGHMTDADRVRLKSVLDVLRRHAGQLDYPPKDNRGPRDAWTWTLTWEQAQAVLRRGGRLCFDCSQFAQQAFRWAGLQDPCGLGFAYAGDTGAMLRTLPEYDNPALAYVGALVIYGPRRGDHVSVVIERSPDPLLESHGRSGLDIVRLSAQRTWHRSPVRLLSVAELG